MAILAMQAGTGKSACATYAARGGERKFMGSIGLILSMVLATGLTPQATGSTFKAAPAGLPGSGFSQATPASSPKPVPSFSGPIRLPVDLYTAGGTHLEKGVYDVEVKVENGQYSLIFRQDDKTQGTIQGEILKDDASDDQLTMPLIGTQFLRSSDDPVGSEAQRHFSKSGLPQYQEESRDWKAALRAYNTQDQKDVRWLFEARQPAGKWLHVQFDLYLNPR